jgi:hypothetical protein
MVAVLHAVERKVRAGITFNKEASQSRQIRLDKCRIGPLTRLLSVFPSVGRQGSTLRAEVRGSSLRKAYAVWFETGELNGKIRSVDVVKDDVQERLSLTKRKIQSSFVPRLRSRSDRRLPPATTCCALFVLADSPILIIFA